jgi:hypothetical protein
MVAVFATFQPRNNLSRDVGKAEVHAILVLESLGVDLYLLGLQR